MWEAGGNPSSRTSRWEIMPERSLPCTVELSPPKKGLSLQKSPAAQGLKPTTTALSSSLLVFFPKAVLRTELTRVWSADMLSNCSPQLLVNCTTCPMRGSPIAEIPGAAPHPADFAGKQGVAPCWGRTPGRTRRLACSWQQTLISCSCFPWCQKYTLHNKQ